MDGGRKNVKKSNRKDVCKGDYLQKTTAGPFCATPRNRHKQQNEAHGSTNPKSVPTSFEFCGEDTTTLIGRVSLKHAQHHATHPHRTPRVQRSTQDKPTRKQLPIWRRNFVERRAKYTVTAITRLLVQAIQSSIATAASGQYQRPALVPALRMIKGGLRPTRADRLQLLLVQMSRVPVEVI